MAKQRHFIREWRLHRGLNQDQLAERIGISRPQLSKIEGNKREADLSLLEIIADALRCDVPDLIVRDPSKPESIWSIWDQIPATERERAVAVLQAFKRTGTDN